MMAQRLTDSQSLLQTCSLLDMHALGDQRRRFKSSPFTRRIGMEETMRSADTRLFSYALLPSAFAPALCNKSSSSFHDCAIVGI